MTKVTSMISLINQSSYCMQLIQERPKISNLLCPNFCRTGCCVQFWPPLAVSMAWVGRTV